MVEHVVELVGVARGLEGGLHEGDESGVGQERVGLLEGVQDLVGLVEVAHGVLEVPVVHALPHGQRRPQRGCIAEELVVARPGLGPLDELERIDGDAVVVDEALGEVEVGEVGGVGRVRLAGRHQAALVDRVEPLAEVDPRRRRRRRPAAADVLRLALQQRAEDHLPLLGGHAAGHGADDPARGGLLVRP